MTPYYQKNGITLYNTDCIEAMRTLPSNSVDSIVTDPPYGISFMGRKWDVEVPSVEVWQECLRVLKPGGHLLSFAGTRTQHRMAVNIEDAGFEIRDMLCWVYGSGFPKSLDVSKAIDKAAGAEREVVGTREKAGDITGGALHAGSNEIGTVVELNITAPATEAAKQWEGWGTALKPSLEPITMARKPFKGSVAANVLEHGTGAINVDGCRVGTNKNVPASPRKGQDRIYGKYGAQNGTEAGHNPDIGRYPANLIHDGSDEVVRLFPDAGGGFGKRGGRHNATVGDYGMGATMETVGFGDSGSAARFFYCAKADKSERRNSKHPTVKPLDVMRYLVRMVTPVGATVLDPFAGSGTTIEAAMREHCHCIGIEREQEYCDDAVKRLDQRGLF